jgi:AAA domain
LLWGADNLAAGARATTTWLWHGYLALGALTLLFGRCHAGKTMLASVLLAHLKKSGEFAGLSLAAANAIVVSGEAADRWQCRSHTLHFGDHVGWFCQPFRGAPTGSRTARCGTGRGEKGGRRLYRSKQIRSLDRLPPLRIKAAA